MDTVNEMEDNVGVALEGEEEEGHRVAQLFEAEVGDTFEVFLHFYI